MAAPSSPATQAQRGEADDDAHALTAEVQRVLQWVRSSADNQGLPFAIVDKKAARLFVYGPRGRLLGAAPALLGEMPGDHTVPGVGDKLPAQVLPEERTTPAGRFLSEPGRNLSGEPVVWVEYDSGFAIHRVRPGAAYERRLQRLATSTPDDNRASLGCVVVSVSFYESVVAPVLGGQRAVVYVLPETRPLASLFGGDTHVVMGR